MRIFGIRNAIDAIMSFGPVKGIFPGDRAQVCRIRRELRLARLGFGRSSWRWSDRLFPAPLDMRPGLRLNPHMAIVGESGSGKSNACKVIVKGLASKGINVAILDPHSEYLGIADSMNAEVYDAAYNGINIFELDGSSEKEKASELTNMFRRAFRLGDVQGYQLYRAIMFTYTRMGAYGKVPSVHDLIYTLEIFRKNAGTGEARIMEGLSRRLSLIDSGSFSRTTPMEMVLRGNSVFLLSSLHTNEAQSIYIEGFLRKVYARMLSMEKSGSTRLYIVIDEAQKLGQHSIIGKLAAEGRKYGIGIIATSQRAKGMDKEIRTNASLFISFYQREPEELNYIANLVAGGNELNRFSEVKKAVRGLGRGDAIVLDSSKRNPSIVSFAENRGERACLPYEIAKLARSCIQEPELLARVAGMGFDDGIVRSRIGKMLEDESLSSHLVGERSGYDGTWYIAGQRNSAEHDVCVNVIKRHLDAMGIKAHIYNSAYGPDIIVRDGRERIAVEYETGSKSRESTEKMLAYRKRLYQRTVMVVNDTKLEGYGSLDAKVISLSDFLASSKLPSA